MFLKGLRKNINPSITPTAAVEMLAQHFITKPVFEARFENYSFVNNNPVSQAMQRMIDLLNEQSDPQDVQSLERFYKSVKTRAEGINNAEGKQKIIIELYDKFFKTALPKVVEQLGIVYTPVEVVDFIIHSVSDVLQKEFGRSLSDENMNIIDPFTGTGTFIPRLLQNGFRKSLEREFSSIYVFNLRGNARTQGELRRKEKDNVFGQGTRTHFSITILVKKAVNQGKATIYYHDIGDYLTRDEKLKKIKDFKCIGNLEMTVLHPNEHGDWINMRNDEFGNFIPLGDKENKGNTNTFFVPCYSNGLKTQRDAWCYNSSSYKLSSNIESAIDFYNSQCDDLANGLISEVSLDENHFSWTWATLNDVKNRKRYNYFDGTTVQSSYRPFFKQHLFMYRSLNEMMYQIPKLYPTDNQDNLVICVPGIGSTKDFSVLITDQIPDLGYNAGCQCFPLYYYEKDQGVQGSLFDEIGSDRYTRREAVSDFILKQARCIYGGVDYGSLRRQHRQRKRHHQRPERVGD